LLRFVPDSPLQPLTTYLLSLNGVKDLDGGYPYKTTRTFTTGFGADDESPTWASNLVDGAADVPPNAVVDLAFGEPIDPVSVSSAPVSLLENGARVAGTSLVFAYGHNVVQLVPGRLLAPGASCEVSIGGLTDESGNPAPPFHASFTTGGAIDTDEIAVVAQSPGPSGVFQVTFNKRTAPSSISSATVYEVDLVRRAAVAGSAMLDASGTVLTFTPDTALPPGAPVEARIEGVQDAAGHLAFWSFDFTTP
jgi:hypothetical protein